MRRVFHFKKIKAGDVIIDKWNDIFLVVARDGKDSMFLLDDSGSHDWVKVLPSDRIKVYL